VKIQLLLVWRSWWCDCLLTHLPCCKEKESDNWGYINTTMKKSTGLLGF